MGFFFYSGIEKKKLLFHPKTRKLYYKTIKPLKPSSWSNNTSIFSVFKSCVTLAYIFIPPTIQEPRSKNKGVNTSGRFSRKTFEFRLGQFFSSI